MGFGDGAGGVRAVGVDPALPQPGGRVQAGGVVLGQARRRLPGEAAENGVDQRRVTRTPAFAGKSDAGIHRGMRRTGEEGELAQAEAEDLADADLVTTEFSSKHFDGMTVARWPAR